MHLRFRADVVLGGLSKSGNPRGIFSRLRSEKLTYLSNLAKVESLRKSFDHIASGRIGRAAGLVRGVDSISIKSFSENLEFNLQALSRRVRDENFKFSELRPIILHDATKNKKRIICVPTVADRIVQRSILNSAAKSQPWLFNSVSYGFIPRSEEEQKGVVAAVKKAKELRLTHAWVFKTDIQKFFDQVDRKILKEEIKKKVRQPSIHKILFQALECEIKYGPRSEEKSIKEAGIKRGKGVRQGMPLSPFFANLMLSDFDKNCIKSGIQLIRYADDLIFFCKSKVEAEDLYIKCQKDLKDLGLKIPKIEEGSKSVISGPEETISFLGVELAPELLGGYILRVGDSQLDNIKGSFYNLANIKELRARNFTLSKLQSSFEAKRAAYSSCYEYCDNISILENRMLSWINGSTQHILNSVGICSKSLSPDARWLLGI